MTPNDDDDYAKRRIDRSGKPDKRHLGLMNRQMLKRYDQTKMIWITLNEGKIVQ